MRTLEIKRISLGSAFRFCFMAGLAGCLLIGVFLILFGASMKKIGFQLNALTWQDSPLQIGATICGLVIGSVGYGLAAGLIGTGGAWFYNCIAARAGGIVIKVND